LPRLSICRVTHALYPDVVGGHAVFCHELSMRQADLGHRVEVLTTRRGRQPERELFRKGYAITRLRRVWMPWDSLGMQNPVMPSLYKIVRERNCSLVDAHAQLFWTTAQSVKAALDAGKPVVTTVHGVLALRNWFVNLCQKLYLWSVGSWALRNSSRVVCLTESEAREVAGLGVGKRNIRVIPIAVDPNLFRPRGTKRQMIVYVGRLVPEKGLETLLDAVAALREKKTVRVLIVGDGPSRNKLIGHAHRLGILDMVTFRFFVDQSQVAEILQESQIFVLPSLKEGLPITLLEAMASANMIVASNLPSIVETLGPAGLYFTPGRSGELAERLLEALNERQLQRKNGLAGREVVEDRFSWGVVLPMLEDLYREVVAG